VEEDIQLSPPASDDDVEALLNGVTNEKGATDDSLEEVEMSFDDEDEDSFFED
jgi:hypothetical protein